MISAPQLSITAFKRPGSSSTFPSAPNLKIVETDYTADALESHFKGQDAVISVVGGTGFADQRGIIDAAVTAGVRRFFPSEFGINGQSEVARQLTPFFAVKGEALDYLVEKERDGLSWTSLIVGPLLDWVRNSDIFGRGIRAEFYRVLVPSKWFLRFRSDVQQSHDLGRWQHTLQLRQRSSARQGRGCMS